MSGHTAQLLFVCSRNRLRSPTAEAVLNGVEAVTAISAGTNNDAETPLSGDLIIWADRIFVMETAHRKKITQKFGGLLKDKPVRNLAIPDNYKFMNPDLVAIIKSRFPEYFS
ncbi:low molecular weight protein tyrosine phosphatase family protein [Sphingorhabdus sp. M41]|uniref:low molecular weight protein tyrosine phosphatase family protein n=1 Tax=Sphingorhabdus sp. M41 TaxID=1806885 RepID=UPI00078CB9CB|nr:phosphotyrosine protein phosphatase [Sphingorhabdus sp. M41]AMO72658.1 phosphotyrosine protein phosphatase [Sphingorhabdus sp. M41]